MGSKWPLMIHRRPPPSNRNGSTPDAIPRVQEMPAITGDWWSIFNDPTLNGLIDTPHRPEPRSADSRYPDPAGRRALAMWRPAIRSRSRNRPFPPMLSAQLPGSFPLPLPSSTLNLFGTGFNASWEIDFWGATVVRWSRPRRISERRWRTTTTPWSSCRPTSPRITWNCLAFQRRIELAQRNIQLQADVLRLAESRFEKGTTSEADAQQARSIWPKPKLCC